MRTRVLAALLLAACATPQVPMRVMLEPGTYSLSMSSTLGLGLRPIAEAPPGMKVRYVWMADAGRFLAQNETTAQIVDLGRTTKTENAGDKLFWSYFSNEPAAREQRPVAITAVAEDAKTGKVLARTDITLVWDGDSVRAAH
jgi:hypothetical protein